MMDDLDCFALMLGGENQAACISFAISSEEIVIVSSRWPQKVGVFGVAWLWRNSAKSSCNLGDGTQSRDRVGRLALKRLNSTPTLLSAAKIHNKDSEAIAALTSAPG